MNINIMHRPAAVLTGISIRTSNQRELSGEGQIPSLWERYFQSGQQSRTDLIHPHLLYALYTDYESDVNGEYTLLLGHEQDHLLSAEDTASTAYIPEADYIKFTTEKGPMGQVVPQLWQEIWDYFQNSEYERTYTGDFELYDLREFNPEEVIVDIYMAVRKPSIL
ncbi:GyrI-like domain-containing protein [Paenibacillus dokdonensis]|uniref:GyrI-like domain-containing protein n=1 Tax=Paenibacillus dokdonensis TaxID=2567944 RepID=A0ABU6GSV7_9BACL|nr:GyrI-like domain-containing protein [Paenibacillus dokdonensis]MEC0242187.1 GyrI-like domain-containing protein [Paenibacillus dokdonensis]